MGKSKNMNRGLMGTDNGVGADCGSRSAEGQGRGEQWEKGGTTVIEQ